MWIFFHRFQVPSVTWPRELENMPNGQKCPIGRLGVKRKLGKWDSVVSPTGRTKNIGPTEVSVFGGEEEYDFQ